MFKKFKNIVNTLVHMKAWLIIKDRDYTYANPNFDSKSLHKISIICIHGAADKAGAFKDLINHILLILPSNIEYVLSVSCNGRKKTIANFANMICKKIQNSGLEKIILIGHSRGGIIAAYLAENLAEINKISVRGVITVGAPFKGSKFIKQPINTIIKSIDEMKENSPFLKTLTSDLKKNKFLHKYLLIAGSTDSLVSRESAQPNIALAHYRLLPDYGHLSILHNPEFYSNCIEMINLWAQ
jgi:pimeloyl-ACP methyl ester carboxylesterase